jgi:hypothetical protein
MSWYDNEWGYAHQMIRKILQELGTSGKGHKYNGGLKLVKVLKTKAFSFCILHS